MDSATILTSLAQTEGVVRFLNEPNIPKNPGPNVLKLFFHAHRTWLIKVQVINLIIYYELLSTDMCKIFNLLIHLFKEKL